MRISSSIFIYLWTGACSFDWNFVHLLKGLIARSQALVRHILVRCYPTWQRSFLSLANNGALATSFLSETRHRHASTDTFLAKLGISSTSGVVVEVARLKRAIISSLRNEKIALEIKKGLLHHTL